MKAVVVALALFAVVFANDLHNMFQEAVAASKAEGGNTWVVLIAGSSGWGNYRHQSSMCKAYQLAHQAGIPDERIITFFQDDIANNSQNPFPGQIFNELYVEGGTNINVYEGVVKDYIRKDASVKNLVNVLSGNPTTSGSGKTLKSTENDNVFIFYDDHGNTGIIAMPTEELFHDHDLTQCIEAWQEKKMFKKLVFFMSACYSGSMFYNQQLPPNVYVATSAPTSASSYACLQDPKLRTYVTSCWPHGWIHSIDVHGMDVDFGTIFEDSYHYANTSSPTSPCQYGDLSLKTTTWGGFMKNTDMKAANRGEMKIVKDPTAVPQYLVPYELAKLNYRLEPTPAHLAELKAESKIRMQVDRMVTEIVSQVMPDNKFLGVQVCKVCDQSCDCYAQCVSLGGTDDHCQRYCCDYAACKANQNQSEEEIECALTLQRAFTESVPASLKNHPYIVSAGIQFNRLCRSGADVTSALKAIDRVCH